MNAGTCDSCGAAVLWVVTRAGERMPIDPELDRLGEVVMMHAHGKGGGEYALVSPLRDVGEGQLALLDDPAPQLERPRYRSHWSTCPHAESHRQAAVFVQRRPGDDDDDGFDRAA